MTPNGETELLTLAAQPDGHLEAAVTAGHSAAVMTAEGGTIVAMASAPTLVGTLVPMRVPTPATRVPHPSRVPASVQVMAPQGEWSGQAARCASRD
jgi:hypothetical protein